MYIDVCVCVYIICILISCVHYKDEDGDFKNGLSDELFCSTTALNKIISEQISLVCEFQIFQFLIVKLKSLKAKKKKNTHILLSPPLIVYGIL